MGDILANMRRMTILWNIVMQYFTLRYNKGMRWNLNGQEDSIWKIYYLMWRGLPYHEIL